MLLCVLSAALCGDAGCGREPRRHDRYGSKKTAWVNAQQFIRERLESPDAADFGQQDPEECVTAFGNGKYRVTGWVDTREKSGDAVRLKFAVVVEYGGKIKWRVLEGPVIH